MNAHTTSEAAGRPVGADRGSPRWAVALLVLAEVALVAAFALSLVTGGLLNIEAEYLRPHLQSYQFTEDRELEEVTYYSRACGPEDVSTVTSRHLWMTNASSPHGAYDTFLRHGAVVFPDVLSRETSAKLRDFVISKNLAQKPGESEFLHSPSHRWVVELGFDEDPIVATALKEISTHPMFRASLAKIFGSPDAALVEFDAITSEFGCQNQSWHTDGSEDRSPLLYGRSFAPTHLMLTPLQDTTPKMGGTALCPGTHYCHSVSDDACVGPYQIAALTHPDREYWPVGHGLLMTTNTYHRGTAFVDPDASHRYRVVLVTTFSPTPRRRYETRQLSLGLSFSLKWYMWGHTLNDFARGGLRRPWADWKALGMYKRCGGNWGYDLVTGFLQRMHGTDCCTLSNNALHEFVENGGPRWLPKFLHATYLLESSDESESTWYEYIVETIRRCHEFVGQMQKCAMLLYIAIMVTCHVCRCHHGARSTKRVLFAHASLYALSCVLRKTVLSKAAWTRDIRDGTKDVVTFPFQLSDYEGPAALPTPHDVLIGTRLDSKHLGMYSDFLQYHPGNTAWHDAIHNRMARGPRYHTEARGLLFQEELARGIVQDMLETKATRFLYQVPSSGKWIVLDTASAVALTTQEHFLQSQPCLRFIAREYRFLRSNCLNSSLRHTKLCRLEPSLIQYLDSQIRHPSTPNEKAPHQDQAVSMFTAAARVDRHFTPRSYCKHISSPRFAMAGAKAVTIRSSQDKDRHSLAPLEGEIVQILVGATTDDDLGSMFPAWWTGKVVSAHPLGVYQVWLQATDDVETFDSAFVCSPLDENCMDSAELYGGWTRTGNGTYVAPDEFHEAADQYDELLDDDVDEEEA